MYLASFCRRYYENKDRGITVYLKENKCFTTHNPAQATYGLREHKMALLSNQPINMELIMEWLFYKPSSKWRECHLNEAIKGPGKGGEDWITLSTTKLTSDSQTEEFIRRHFVKSSARNNKKQSGDKRIWYYHFNEKWMRITLKGRTSYSIKKKKPCYVGPSSVGRSVGWWSPFYFFGISRLFEPTAPAQML